MLKWVTMCGTKREVKSDSTAGSKHYVTSTFAPICKYITNLSMILDCFVPFGDF